MFLQVNKKTRNRAYDVLVQIGHAYADEENGGDNEKLHGYFNMVCINLNPNKVIFNIFFRSFVFPFYVKID